MNRNVSSFLKKLLLSVIFWTLAMFCFAVFRFYGLGQEIGISIEEGFEDGAFVQPTIFTSLLGFGLGILYAILDFLVEKYVTKRISLGFNLLLKTGLYFVVTVIMASIVISVAYKILDFDLSIEAGWWHRDKRFWAMIFYIIIASIVFSFLTMASERFGRGMFVKMLLGKYKKPREEERIFMFLDLKNSTTIAETLGHYNYSAFIQECFYDLNEQILSYDAEIYQYVGDEAVLSWPYKKGVFNNNCIRLFFAFKRQLESRKEQYLKKYNVFPEFKAGVHGGALMITEVGSIKKEIAYHGDVINTTARIQAECNKYQVNLLLSEKVLNDLKIDKHSHTESLGSVILKGKKTSIKIHALINIA